MQIMIEVINGTIQEVEDKAIELEENNKTSYVIMKYNDMSEIIESRAKYINKVRSKINSEADIDDAYKRGWNDCKQSMMQKILT